MCTGPVWDPEETIGQADPESLSLTAGDIASQFLD